MLQGKPYSLYRRNRIYYVRFKQPNNQWGAAKSTGQTSKGKAERWAFDYLSAGQIVRRNNISFAEFSKDFFSWTGPWATDKKATGKRITIRQCHENMAILNNRLLPVFGKMRLTSIDKTSIKDFRNDLYQQGYAGSTINKALSCLKTILEAAEDKSLIQYVPKVERAANRPKLRGILTVDEVRQIFSIDWLDYRAYVMNLMAASTGLRRGELLALTLQEVHDNYITISRSWDEAFGVLNETTKTGRSRTIIIPTNLQSEIERLIQINPWGKPDSFLFFSSIESKPIEGKIISKDLYRALRQIGIGNKERIERNITFHSWRHWFNSLLINARIPLQKIQSLTGHLTNEMTQHYYHPDEMSDVLKVVQDSLFSINQYPTTMNK
jgi:integrase